MKVKSREFILGAILIVVLSVGQITAWHEEKAQRVLNLIALLEREMLSPKKPDHLRKITITEEEFNA